MRATAAGFCYHQGAIWGGLVGPLLAAWAATMPDGFTMPMLIITVASEIVFIIALLLGPETKGKELGSELQLAHAPAASDWGHAPPRASRDSLSRFRERLFFSARQCREVRRHDEGNGAAVFGDRIAEPRIARPDRRRHDCLGIGEAGAAALRQYRGRVDGHDGDSRGWLCRRNRVAAPAQHA